MLPRVALDLSVSCAVIYGYYCKLLEASIWRGSPSNLRINWTSDSGELRNLYGAPPYGSLAEELLRRIEELRAQTDDHYVYSEPAAKLVLDWKSRAVFQFQSRS